MKIQAVVVPGSGIHYHRLINPLAYLPVRDDIQISIVQNGWDEQKVDCDILMYNKWLASTPVYIRQLQAKGTKIIVDVDDYWEVSPSHPNYESFKIGNIPQLTVEHIKLADVVTCTTDRLRDRILELNKNVVVIPNALPFGHDQYQVGDRSRGREISGHNKTRFMYLSGVTHTDDVDSLSGKFERIGGDPWMVDNAEFLLCGYNPTYKNLYKTEEDYNARNSNYVTKEVPGEYDKMATVFRKTKSFKIYPSVDLDNYLNYYDSADVALGPLVDNSWNSCKSGLKIVEAAVKRIPVICSKVAPYIDMIEFKNNCGIMWVEKPSEWIEYFKYCIKNPEWVNEQGERLYQWVSQEYDLIKVNELRLELFKSLCK